MAAGQSYVLEGPFRVGDWHVDPTSGEIRRADRRVTLAPKAMDVLCHLASRPGQIVSANELLDAVWRGAEVAPGALYQTVLQLRKALEDGAGSPSLIENVPRRGYRLIAPVTAISAVADSAPVPSAVQSPAVAAPVVARWSRRVALAGGVVVLAAVAVWWARWGQDTDTPPSSAPSVGVLPFRAPADAAGAEHLAEGITDEVVMSLAQLTGLAVTGRTSSFQLKDSKASPRELGALLGVSYLLEGRVQMRDGVARIDAALVSTATGLQIWAERFDATSAHLPRVQEDIARAVARSLDLLLTESSSRRLAQRAGRDPRAFELYLRGRYQWNRRDRNTLPQARALFEQAVALDPDDADVHIALAEVYAVLPLYGVALPDVAYPMAQRAAERALQLDGGRGEAHATLATIRYQYLHDWPGAEAQFRKAIELSPNHASTRQWYSEFLSYSRRFAQAREQIAAAHALDPIAPVVLVLRGSPALWARDYEQAARVYREALAKTDGFPLAAYSLGLAELGAGRPAAAVTALRQSQAGLGAMFVAPSLAHALVAAGEPGKARELLHSMQAEAASQTSSPYKLAVLYLALGAKAEALQLLELAEQQHDDRLVLLAVDPLLDALRGEARFKAIERRIGLDQVFVTPSR